MPNKTVFVVLVVISTVSLLLYWRPHSSTFAAISRSFSRSCTLPLSGGKAKHTSVVFCKTHKTASSTVQNILFRFAERHNLTMAMPVPKCGMHFCYPDPFSAHFVRKDTTPPDMLTNHARFNVAEMRRLMPSDTRYFTIMREPVAMFESAFSYFRPECKSFQRVPNGSIEAFLRQPQLYYQHKEKSSMLARNTVTFDLGGDKDRPAGDQEYLWRFTKQLEDIFSLVMIAEHFDESLVLLRRLLNWEAEDLVYLKQNMRADESRKRLQGSLPAQVRAWNWLDAALYDYFNASLWRQLEQLGPACLEDELRLLHKAQDRVMQNCFGTTRPQMKAGGQIGNKTLKPWQPGGNVIIYGYDLPSNGTKSQRAQRNERKGGERDYGGQGEKRGNDKNEGKVECGGITKDFCMKMIMPELSYTQLLLRTQPLQNKNMGGITCK